ncbi:hypothetical protein Zm00014a_026873 [Zea mays]|uniref:Uncharacterized protein n=1 Tax=Zea mays TaxID=4577 RepID=A0A3L6DL48_MAIZE|nr:hypothetical protein Zm00014a_026873 [Zea mays]
MMHNSSAYSRKKKGFQGIRHCFRVVRPQWIGLTPPRRQPEST